MNKSDFYYDLPQELIAQDPLKDRSSSRLLILDRKTGEIKHGVFTDIVDYLQPGDCLVRNNTKVIPARLLGTKINDGAGGNEDGACVEILLLKRKELDVWETIVKPGKRLKPGARVSFGEGKLIATILDITDEGNRIVRFDYAGVFENILDELGQMPLPPYITHRLEDKNRYQTVYAKNAGSAAAPTAGLHFTDELFKKLEAKGVIVANVTLHVGLGTFRPVKEENILDHHMHTEEYHVSEVEAEKINNAKKNGGRIICVGTTSCRTIESIATPNHIVEPGQGDTSIFIYPGYDFKMMDGLITNFHLPESTLLMLVSAFSSRENIMAAYNEAVKEKYRFFSFDDAMLII